MRQTTAIAHRIILLLFICGVVPEVEAQVKYGADLVWHSRYEWRGLTIREGMVLQPDLYLSGGSRFTVTVGGWTNIELTTPGTGEFGDGRRVFGESNVWAELGTSLGGTDLAVGWHWFRFDTRRSTRTPIGRFDTHEIYGRLQLSNLPVFVPRVDYFHDIDEAAGGFVEASLTMRVPFWTQVKAPLGSLLLTGVTGYNVGQDSIAGIERFQDRGFKYAELMVSTVTGYLPVSLFDAIHAKVALSAGFHVQFNLDPTTKRTFNDGVRQRETWWTIGLQWSGPRCEPTHQVCGSR